jgi:HEAT repeat protein
LSSWGTTPRQSISAYVAAHGAERFVAGCLVLLDDGDDPELVAALAGPAATGFADDDARYWPRVWALRGLRWQWAERAAPAVVAALRDEHWRVREMAARVCGAHLVGEALPALVALAGDPVPRVVAASGSAVRRIVGAGA